MLLKPWRAIRYHHLQAMITEKSNLFLIVGSTPVSSFSTELVLVIILVVLPKEVDRLFKTHRCFSGHVLNAAT